MRVNRMRIVDVSEELLDYLGEGVEEIIIAVCRIIDCFPHSDWSLIFIISHLL